MFAKLSPQNFRSTELPNLVVWKNLKELSYSRFPFAKIEIDEAWEAEKERRPKVCEPRFFSGS